MATRRKRPRDRASWDQRYQEGEVPWDSGIPDMHLRAVVEAFDIRGKALEVGCGTGTNSIWLAQQGFDVTGVDLSPTALAKAETKARSAGVDCHFVATDFLVDSVPGGPFDFVYDRGCFHVFDEDDERSQFAARVAEMLAPEGIWHSLIGSTDGPPRDTGPPRRSATEVVTAVEPHFEILELESRPFDQDRHLHARAWVLVSKRR